MTQRAANDRRFALPGELPVTVSEADAVLAAHLSATLHARLDWKQADACAADIVNLFSRKGWRVVRSAVNPD